MSKIKNKLLVAFVLISLIPLVTLGAYGLFNISKSLESSSVEKLESQISSFSSGIANFLKNVSNDLFYLRDSSSLHSLIESSPLSSRSAIQGLQNDFLAFSEHKKIYNQIRFLDPEGMEIVRVDRRLGKSTIIEENKLQNKKSRYYFADTINLAKGQLMISPLDLNRENGKVERPRHPVIRYGTPVFDKDNTLKGIILFNVQADNFLDPLRKKEAKGSQLYFVDSKGFYYVNPDPAKEWGGPADLDTGSNVKKDFPDIASSLLATKTTKQISHGEHIVVGAPVFLDAEQEKKLGVIVNVAQTEEVLRSVVTFRNIFLLLGGIVFFTTLVIAIGLAKSITNPLLHLTEITKNMSKGKLSTPVNITTKDEIKLLGESIERLRKSMVILLKRSTRR